MGGKLFISKFLTSTNRRAIYYFLSVPCQCQMLFLSKIKSLPLFQTLQRKNPLSPTKQNYLSSRVNAWLGRNFTMLFLLLFMCVSMQPYSCISCPKKCICEYAKSVQCFRVQAVPSDIPKDARKLNLGYNHIKELKVRPRANGVSIDILCYLRGIGCCIYYRLWC